MQIELLDFKTDLMNFNIDRNCNFEQDSVIVPEFARSITKINDNVFKLVLKTRITDNDVSSNLPFNAEISIYGVFSLSNWEDIANKSLVMDNTSAILFPYLRNTLSTLTMLSGLPPYILPVINITEVFSK